MLVAVTRSSTQILLQKVGDWNSVLFFEYRHGESTSLVTSRIIFQLNAFSAFANLSSKFVFDHDGSILAGKCANT